MIRFFAIADVVFDDVAFGLRDHAAVLRRGSLFLIIIVVAKKKRIVARNLELCKRTRSGFARPRVYDLNNLIKSDRSRVDGCKARQDRSHAYGRKEYPKVNISHVCNLTQTVSKAKTNVFSQFGWHSLSN